MRVKNKRLSDDDIAQYCESVEKLLGSIHERSVTKKRKKEVELEPELAEDDVVPDEEFLVMS